MNQTSDSSGGRMEWSDCDEIGCFGGQRLSRGAFGAGTVGAPNAPSRRRRASSPMRRPKGEIFCYGRSVRCRGSVHRVVFEIVEGEYESKVAPIHGQVFPFSTTRAARAPVHRALEPRSRKAAQYEMPQLPGGRRLISGRKLLRPTQSHGGRAGSSVRRHEIHRSFCDWSRVATSTRDTGRLCRERVQCALQGTR